MKFNNNFMLIFGYLTILCINSINSGMVSQSFEKVRGELVCNLETEVKNVSYVDVYIHPEYLADR